MVVLIFAEVGLEERPGADQGHLPDEDVDQLGQLVEAPPAQKSAETRGARIITNLEEARVAGVIQVSKLLLLEISPLPHCPELDHPEPFTAETGAFLEEERRAGRIEPDSDGNEEQDRREEDEQHTAQEHIHDSLGDKCARLEDRAAQLEERLV